MSSRAPYKWTDSIGAVLIAYGWVALVPLYFSRDIWHDAAFIVVALVVACHADANAANLDVAKADINDLLAERRYLIEEIEQLKAKNASQMNIIRQKVWPNEIVEAQSDVAAPSEERKWDDLRCRLEAVAGELPS